MNSAYVSPKISRVRPTYGHVGTGLLKLSRVRLADSRVTARLPTRSVRLGCIRLGHPYVDLSQMLARTD